MTDIKYILYSLLLGMMMVSCSASDDIADDVDTPQAAQQVDLLISVGNKVSKSRQMSANASLRAATFQGMEGLVAIPFQTGGNAVAPSDAPLVDVVGATEHDNRVEEHNNYYVDHCYFMTGTDRILVYGKSNPSSDDPTVNGVLSDLPTVRTKLENIHFSLSSIRNTTEVHSDAQALADYMTAIANSEGWSTTDDVTLKSYYMDFIRAKSEDGGLMSGAAVNIKAFVAALKTQLAGRTDAVSTAIKANIDNKTVTIDETVYNVDDNTYPRSIGLPDGAAVIRWVKNEETGEEEFSVRTNRSAFDNINGITRYTYPAALMFFTDSPIRTSSTEVPKETYEEASVNTKWSDFLDAHYNTSQTVSNITKAVAVVNPLQYGVANLQLTLTGMATTLKDAKDEEVTNADMDLPLCGVIIGGQHTVGYNMKPQGEQTDVDECFIYETNIVSGDAGKSINTLVLQSYDDEKVPVILEFENNTDKSFTGKDGKIYPGTRFYLIGMIDPADKKEEGKDYTNRVFTQDYTTTMTMSVTSLAKAYTSMPDLLAPRLEIGVQIVTNWIQVTTTNVEL